MKRRLFLAQLAALAATPAMAQVLPERGGLVDIPRQEGEYQRISLNRPWGQVLRTFGDPVLEGHFSMRVTAREGHLDMAMWDRGDRLLGLGQFSSMEAQELWPLVEAIMARRPDLTIGPGAYMFQSDHYETAHWQIDDVVANRTGRYREAENVQASSWMRPSHGIAKAIRPLSRHIGPPWGSYSHILWTEPAPEVPGGPKAVNTIRLGSGAHPEIEDRLRDIAASGRMIATLDGRAARRYIESLGPLVQFAATLTDVQMPDGSLWGRCRILTV